MSRCGVCGNEVQAVAERCIRCGAALRNRRWNGPMLLRGVMLAALSLGSMYVFRECDRASDRWNREAAERKVVEAAQDRLRSAHLMMQEFVKRKLTSPGSAKFPCAWDGYDITKQVRDLGGGRYRIESWVDSQNAFGAFLRSNFVGVVVNVGNDQWRLEDLTFDEG